jgi:uncharacterized repeat protein (TIGR03803 family)
VDSVGNVYLPTYGGGDPNGNGNGTLVKIDPRGRTTVLHTFNGADGRHPYGGVLFSEMDGKIFGTTCEGGPSGSVGVIYELDADGTYKMLHSFSNSDDGVCPVDAPVRDTKGNLYGVTNGDTLGGCGVIWKFSAKGAFSILHRLDGPSYGCNPFGRLTWDNSGKGPVLFGMGYGGGNQNVGTVFYYFPSTGGYGTSVDFNFSNGAFPYGFLIVDKHGNLYGTASGGGAYDGGVIFKVNPDN